jgi:aldehyde:ferredoxin oxidoreductase
LPRVNLTDRQVSEEPLDPKLARDYIGGAGLGVRLAYEESPPETDALGPDAKLIIMTGPVTATRLGTAGRYEVIYKAPLTGILCDASSGGHWGAEFKWAGYDGPILEGISAEPV